MRRIPYRTEADLIGGGQGRSAIGKLHFIGAIEVSPEGHPRRIRLAPLQDFSAPGIGAFVAGAVTPGATILSDGFSSYRSPRLARVLGSVLIRSLASICPACCRART